MSHTILELNRDLIKPYIDRTASSESVTTSLTSFKSVTGGVFSNLVVNLDTIQAGSGDPSSSNTRLIFPHTEVKVIVGGEGKNLCPYIVEGMIDNTTGEDIENLYVYRTGFIKMEAGKTYTISGIGSGDIRLFKYNADKSFIEGTWVSSDRTFTFTSWTGYFRFQFDRGRYIDDKVQVEEGSTATSYTPYNGKEIVVKLDNLYYGGTLDLVSGKLLVNYACKVLGDLSWTYNDVDDNFYSDVSVSDAKYSGDYGNGICENYFVNNITGRYMTDGGFKIQNNGRIYIKDTRYSDAATFKTAIAKVKLVYELATSQVIQLTPTEVRYLAGENEISTPLNGQSIPSLNYQSVISYDDIAGATEHNLKDTVQDSVPYVRRLSKGNMVDMELIGASIIWNQLISNGNFSNGTNGWGKFNANTSAAYGVCEVEATSANNTQGINTTSLTGPSGHAYLISFNLKTDGTDIKFGVSGSSSSLNTNNIMSEVAATTGWKNYSAIFIPASNLSGLRIGTYSANSLAVGESLYIQNITCFDLTKMFGPDVADYIYSLEAANAGTGVALFKEYFGSGYYALNSGTIKSVNPSGRRVVGKNLWPFGDFSGTQIKVPFSLPAGTYTISGDVDAPNFGIRLFQANGDDSIADTAPSGGKMTLTTNDDIVAITYSSDYGSVTNVQMERGSTKTKFEPYTEYIYPFDKSLELRGILKVGSNGKLYADGDIYNADGRVTRNYEIVTYDGSEDELWQDGLNVGYIYITPTVAGKKPANNATKWDALCNYLEVKPFNNVYFSSEEGAAMSLSGNVAFHIPGVTDISTDMATVRSYLSSHPLTIIYKRETPTTELAVSYQNPQRSFKDSIEEFIYNNTIPIPVGNNSKYYLSDALPNSADYSDGAVAIGVNKLAENSYVNGAVNLIPNLFTSKVANGITAVTNDDGSVTINGTATADTQVNVTHRLDNHFTLPVGKYKLSGYPASEYGKGRIFLNFTNANGNSEAYCYDYGYGATFEVKESNFSNRYAIGYNVMIDNGSTFSNTVIKPMITLVDMPNSDYEHYAPYAMTNQQLTENKIDASEIAPIENGTTASTNYAQGAYFIHNGKFCKAKTAIASGASFTLNTNYEVTTVAAEFIALNS